MLKRSTFHIREISKSNNLISGLISMIALGNCREGRVEDASKGLGFCHVPLRSMYGRISLYNWAKIDFYLIFTRVPRKSSVFNYHYDDQKKKYHHGIILQSPNIKWQKETYQVGALACGGFASFKFWYLHFANKIFS